MRAFLWLAAVLAVAGEGCALPCATGTCLPGASACAVSSTGCATGVCRTPFYLTHAKYWPALDGFVTTHTAKKCAKTILWNQQWQSGQLVSSDYKSGFIQAFVDIANGGTGETPAVPPAKYWNACYRSVSGRQKVDDWFNGYRDGASQGRNELHSLRQITSSGDWNSGRAFPTASSACISGQNTGGTSSSAQFASAASRAAGWSSGPMMPPYEEALLPSADAFPFPPNSMMPDPMANPGMSFQPFSPDSAGGIQESFPSPALMNAEPTGSLGPGYSNPGESQSESSTPGPMSDQSLQQETHDPSAAIPRRMDPQVPDFGLRHSSFSPGHSVPSNPHRDPLRSRSPDGRSQPPVVRQMDRKEWTGGLSDADDFEEDTDSSGGIPEKTIWLVMPQAPN